MQWPLSIDQRCMGRCLGVLACNFVRMSDGEMAYDVLTGPLSLYASLLMSVSLCLSANFKMGQ